ncbi:MAG: type VII secretion protein EssC, partial [Lachnospiraceae bacterium]|nr:type VII secretion protein EssC [Lachnospiraceae bacterium]
EIYELFQSAWSGASYVSEKEEAKVDDRVYLLNDLGQGELVNEDLSDENEGSKTVITQLDATVDYVHTLYEQMDTVEVKRPWLPPLPEQMVSPIALAEGKSVDLMLTLGVIDIPEEQKQEEYRLNLAKDGNILYLASAGYGKSVFLTTAVLSLAMRNAVELVQFYILDFGNSGLIPLNRLHHVADYISFDDSERFVKFMTILQNEISSRKKQLAESMVQNFEVYNQVSPEPMKAIVVAVDNYDVVKELGYDAEEFFTKLSRDGAGLGIFLIVTATRSNAMKYSTYNNFKNKIAGYLFDESDVHVVVGRSSYKQSEIKGRALIKYNGQVSVMQNYV